MKFTNSTLECTKARFSVSEKSKNMHTLSRPLQGRKATLLPVAAARAWNALPLSVRAVQSLLLVRRELKTTLFRASYA